MSQINQNNICADERIHLAISRGDLTDDYNRHAGALILSFLEHCSIPVTIHILYNGLSSFGKEDEEMFNKLCYYEISEKYDCELLFHAVCLPEWILSLGCFKKQWNPATLLRLYLPELLSDIDKVIYLDCDMIVLTDVKKLWDISLLDNYLGACLDSWIVNNTSKNRKKYYESIGIDVSNYFNAGMLLLNLRKFRELKKPFSEIVFSYLRQNQNLPFLDQDILNWFCHGHYLVLDNKYNFPSWNCSNGEVVNDCIIHYTISKPWMMYNGDIDNYYWDYLRCTPWCKTDLEFMQYLREAPNMKKVRHTISKNLFATFYTESTSAKVILAFKFFLLTIINCIGDAWNYLLTRINEFCHIR